VSRPWIRDERGAALVVALLMAILLGAIGASLITLSNTETLIAATYRHAIETTYGAEAGLERAVHDLATIADWSVVLAAPPANLTSTAMDDGTLRPRTPGGRTLNLAGLTDARQRESDTRDGGDRYRADAPQWRLYGHAPISDLSDSANLLSGAAEPPPIYVIVWVADDGADGDGDPETDANGRILVHAEAYGPAGARRAAEASIERLADGVVRAGAWRIRR
jgi:hypothetical protein